jgi:hypothetical protein
MDFRDSQEASVNMATDALESAAAPAADTSSKHGGAKRKLNTRGDSKAVKQQLYPVEVDHSRDALLTDFGKDTLTDRYLLPGEKFQDLFVRVASAYADDAPFSRTAAPGAACPSPASSTQCPTAWTASSRPGTRMSGSPHAAAASAPIGAMCAASASRSA